MYVKSLALNQFRNYDHLEMALSPGINILYGDNAQGKTNIIEALYMSATTKSHRGSKDREMISFGSEESHIRVMMQKDAVAHKIDMHLKKNKSKGIAIDGLPIKRSGELFGMLHMICFSPEDLSMIKNGPAERRRFMDMELCQLDHIYLSDLSSYNRIVNQRSNLLRQIAFDDKLKDTLDIWDAQMISFGQKVIRRRSSFIHQLNEWIRPIHKTLTGGEENLEIIYQPSTSADRFEYQLSMQREHDLMMKQSTVGPHRDDMVFKVKGIDLRKFGSQGQQRTAALSLKLAEIELVRQLIGDTPVLLLDDVLSELDSHRQNYLMTCIQNIQTVITCTGLDEFIENRLTVDRIYRVDHGTVSEMNRLKTGGEE